MYCIRNKLYNIFLIMSYIIRTKAWIDSHYVDSISLDLNDCSQTHALSQCSTETASLDHFLHSKWWSYAWGFRRSQACLYNSHWIDLNRPLIFYPCQNNDLKTGYFTWEWVYARNAYLRYRGNIVWWNLYLWPIPSMCAIAKTIHTNWVILTKQRLSLKCCQSL